MNTSQKGFIVPLLLVIIALLLVGGAYVYTQPKQESQSAKTSTTETSNTQTTDWKTYSNSKLGFEFQYPPSSSSFGTPNPVEKTTMSGPNEQLKNIQNSVLFNDQLTFISGIQYNRSTGRPMTIDELTLGGSNKKQIVVDGITGIEVSSSQIGTVIYLPLPNNEIFTILGPLDHTLLDQILSTFRFTK